MVQPDKQIILTASQFNWCLALNESPELARVQQKLQQKSLRGHFGKKQGLWARVDGVGRGGGGHLLSDEWRLGLQNQTFFELLSLLFIFLNLAFNAVNIFFLFYRGTCYFWPQRNWSCSYTWPGRCWSVGSRGRYFRTKETSDCERAWWPGDCSSGMWRNAHCGPH